MFVKLLPLHLLVILTPGLGDPAPGRIPKVYNALITSNQNLEPSKAFPVYQPVLHDTFAYPFQPAVFYPGHIPINGLIPAPPVLRSNPGEPSATAPQTPPAVPPKELPPATPSPTAPETNVADAKPESTAAPPPPPNTESPIPLNQFGLPPQVTPLGHIDPAYNGFTQVGPFTYAFPSIKFYDPYEPFSYNTYTNLSPIFNRPLTNILEPALPIVPGKPVPEPESAVTEQPPQTPPSEPSDINLLNYSSKDPAIPNVPPPPLPQGGLKSDDKTE